MLAADTLNIREILHGYAVILTQDCDLEQDFAARQQGDVNNKWIPNILFCDVISAEQLKGDNALYSTLWKEVKINKSERYHFLQMIDEPCDKLQIGMPELGIDFKRYFSLPTDEVYKRIELRQTERRSILASPYLEHLSHRFANFLSRVALPLDHASQ